MGCRRMGGLVARGPVVGTTLSVILLVLLGSATPGAAAVPDQVVSASTSRSLFVGQTSAPGRPVTLVTSMNDFEVSVPDPTPTLAAAVLAYFQNGGVDLWVVSTPDEQPATLAAALDAVPSTTQASLFVVPSLGDLSGGGYDTVVSSLAALADRSLGMAILDPPGAVVDAVEAADDVTPLVDLAAHLRVVVPRDRTRRLALYGSRFVADDQGAPTVPTGTLISVAALMAGVFTTTDGQAGVWVSPAGPGRALAPGTATPDEAGARTNAQHAQLNAAGVDAIDSSADGAVHPMGAKTLDPDSDDFKYISVDRTLDYIQRSLTAGLGYTVFSPNNAKLWERLDADATAFLTPLWKEGGLAGATPGTAFRVTTGGTTDTAQDVAAGLVRMRILVSTTYPDEFTQLDIVLRTQAP